MINLNDFRDSGLARGLALQLQSEVHSSMRFMEVCGTHTMSIARHGLRELFPQGLTMVSGPGCPVCVTSQGEVDTFINMAQLPGVIIATFGDLVRVPGTTLSLSSARAKGAQVEVVYSPMDALRLAQERPGDTVVFLAIGFETTIPAVAATVKEADRLGLDNLLFFVMHKIMPPALNALVSDPGLQIQGFLCPGHVSTIIGMEAYEPLVKDFGIPCVIAGFEPPDILKGLLLLARQVNQGVAIVENAYPRAVLPEGNRKARETISEVFEPLDAIWRGLGVIKRSGLKLREKYSHFDALKRLGITLQDTPEPKGCRCGDILKGKAFPRECPLFGTRCTPVHPVGPCMVSTEGTCAAYYRYGG